MNPVIRLLLISDFLILTGFGFVDPILAVFVSDRIQGGSLFMAGIAVGLFLVVKSLVQIPFARHVDHHNNVRDLRWLVIGTVFMAVTPLLYLIADDISTILIAQVVCGIGIGLSNPVWFGLWSAYLDDGRMSFEWSADSTLVGLGTSAAAAIGGGVAEFFGFNAVFLMMFILTVIGGIVLFTLSQLLHKNAGRDHSLLYQKGKKHGQRKKIKSFV